MCIRDRRVLETDLRDVEALLEGHLLNIPNTVLAEVPSGGCLLYTSDAADERSSVDLGGRRIIKKKNNE